MTTSDDFQNALKGILDPRPISVKRETILWRFASSKDPKSGAPKCCDYWYNSPWWMMGADFAAIYGYSGQGSSSARDARITRRARADLAVLHPWSQLDVIVKAKVDADISAYAGVGAPQNTEEYEWPWRQMQPSRAIQQLYLCNFDKVRGFLRQAGEWHLA